MKIFAKLLIGLALVGFLLLPGCGDDGDDDDDNGGYRVAEYWPLGQGDTWTYLEDGDSEQITISGTETVDGVEAVKVQEDDGEYELWTNTNGLTVYGRYDTSLGQYIYNPPLIYAPSQMSIGSQHTFSSNIIVTSVPLGSISGTSTLEGVEDVTVSAGTFTGCLKLKITHTSSSADGSYTQSCERTILTAQGVGEVRSTEHCTVTMGTIQADTDTTRELVSATVGGISYP